MPAAHGHGPAVWLHLIPLDRAVTPPPPAVAAVDAVLCTSGLAVRAGDGLAPGPRFPEWLLSGPPPPSGDRADRLGPVPLAARPAALPPRAQGEVRVEAGVLRVYPDPGPLGFRSPEPRRYRADCPACGDPLDLYRLAFPGADPLTGACPSCAAAVAVAELDWQPALAAARFEITFGGLDGRPSLRGREVFGALERAAGCALQEVHVTL